MSIGLITSLHWKYGTVKIVVYALTCFIFSSPITGKVSLLSFSFVSISLLVLFVIVHVQIVDVSLCIGFLVTLGLIVDETGAAIVLLEFVAERFVISLFGLAVLAASKTVV